MKKTTLKLVVSLMAVLVLAGSCSSSTVINSSPQGAKVYVNGESVGTTPYKYSDTKIVGSSSYIKLEKEGYQPFQTVITRNEQVDVGAIIGGVFLLVPFLWTMKYKPEHFYDLTPQDGTKEESGLTSSQIDDLKKLKELLDGKVLTEAEYEQGKKKILDK